jgi:alpha-L-fucosidase
MPTDQLKDVNWLVKENIVPYNNAYCNFILNVAPNRDGLMDNNALEALRQIGSMWKNEGPTQPIPECDAPIVTTNIAKHQPTEYSWSYDCMIGDFANNDDFTDSWESHPLVQQPWWEVTLDSKKPFQRITILEQQAGAIQEYRLEYLNKGKWTTLFEGPAAPGRLKQHTFPAIKAE